jgi:hypothetical protein
MPRHPFDFQNIVHLVEYLVEHSPEVAHRVPFHVKLSIRPGDTGTEILEQLYPLEQLCSAIHAEPISMSFRGTFTGLGALVNLFEATPYTIESITWKGGHGNEVTVDCIAREVHVATDSISFLEICRHKMTGQGVRKFTADLKIQ